jgi:hypothetical protein
MFTLEIPVILQYLRPGEDYILRDNARDYSKLEWIANTTKPTEQEMLDAELSASKITRISMIKIEAQQRIILAYPAWRQINAALGFYDNTETNLIKDGINAIRSASNTAEADVTALTSVADVLSFSW